MTADQHLTWTGDPTILVYAVRGVLGHSGSHAPTLVADTILGNRRQLTDAGRPDIAFRYLRTWLARQCDIRFAHARIRLALREELPVIVTNLTAFTAAAEQTAAAMDRLAEQLAVR